MSVFTQLNNKLQYTIHNLTYDSSAEDYAKKMEESKKKTAELEASLAASSTEEKQRKRKEAADAEVAAEATAERKRRETFSTGGAIGEALGIIFTILLVFLLLSFGILGASLATNLNIYHSAPYRVFYAIYGFFFFFLVIPYVLGYRWWYQGKKPKFYALVPLVPYHFDHQLTAFFLSWMSYKPDLQIDLLKEWKNPQN